MWGAHLSLGDRRKEEGEKPSMEVPTPGNESEAGDPAALPSLV